MPKDRQDINVLCQFFMHFISANALTGVVLRAVRGRAHHKKKQRRMTTPNDIHFESTALQGAKIRGLTKPT